MKKLNKAMSVAVAAAMMVSLGACGNSADAAKDGTQSAGASGKVYNIGICQQLEHPALDQATQGFEDVLKEKLGDNVKFDLQNAQNEQANASTIANNFVSSNVDLILANATTALQACAAATTDIPILGTSVTDYATALEISDWSGTTGRNISGTSDLAPLDQQEDMLVELYPDAKHVAILYCSAEANSKYQATEFEKYLDEDGISYKEYAPSMPEMLEETRKILCDGVELFMARDKEQAKEFYKRDDKIDDLFNQVKEELVACLKEGKKDTDACVDLLMVAKYLERIGDHAVNISEWEVFKETGSIKNERIL